MSNVLTKQIRERIELQGEFAYKTGVFPLVVGAMKEIYEAESTEERVASAHGR